jgi:polyphenol oxidase
METRVMATGAPPLLVSKLLPKDFVHGFTSRAGGISGPPFSSLNLGMKWGDARENVVENRRRLLLAVAAPAFHVARQVHGPRVLVVAQGASVERTAAEEADALCTDASGIALAVYVADCVPVLLADPRSGAFAAVHAGWRGTVAGVIGETVAALTTNYGARPADLRVALGPAIGRCCFEVGAEVVAAFAAAVPDSTEVIVETPGAKPHIDLRRALRIMLERAGVAPGSIDAETACTSCDPEGRFFSYRRDRGLTGQHMAFINRL